MRIVYTGPMTPGSVSLARMRSLQTLGHEVVIVDQRPFFRGGGLWDKIQAHALIGPNVEAFGRELCAVASRVRPQLTFMEGFYLAPRSVERLRHAGGGFLVGYTSDYLEYRSYFYRHLRRSAGLYDAIVITNTLNREHLRRWDARNVLMTPFGFDPAEHFPVEPSSEQRARFECDVVFCGHKEPFYADMLRALKRAGLRLRVAGKAWLDASFLEPHERMGFVSPADYRAMVSSAKVAPAFLSKWNRNTSGGRIFEVAGMGGLLLAERTEEQLGYFQDGVEAEFFSSADELVAKTKRHVADEELRRTVAAAGHRRCLQSGYTYADRMRQLVADLEAIMPTRKD